MRPKRLQSPLLGRSRTTHNGYHGHRGPVLDDIFCVLHKFSVTISSAHFTGDSGVFFRGLLQHRRMSSRFLCASSRSAFSTCLCPFTSCSTINQVASPLSFFQILFNILRFASPHSCGPLWNLAEPGRSNSLAQFFPMPRPLPSCFFFFLPARVFFWSSSSGHPIAASVDCSLSRPCIHLVPVLSPFALQPSSLQLPALVLLSLHWFSPLLVGCGHCP